MITLRREFSLYMILASVLGFAFPALPAQDNEIHWLGDYKEALRLAKETGKPIFLEFRCEA